MPDDPILYRFRVTFLNVHNGVTYEVLVSTPIRWRALPLAQTALSEHLTKTAGQVHDWVHYSTAELPKA